MAQPSSTASNNSFPYLADVHQNTAIQCVAYGMWISGAQTPSHALLPAMRKNLQMKRSPISVSRDSKTMQTFPCKQGMTKLHQAKELEHNYIWLVFFSQKTCFYPFQKYLSTRIASPKREGGQNADESSDLF